MKVSVDKIKPHPLNGKIYTLMNVDDLVASIEEQGLLTPLVINQNNFCMSGHRRLEALRRLGLKKVEVTRVTTTEDDVPLILVHANKQRVKTYSEILNEYEILSQAAAVGKGRRNDLDETYDRTAVSESPSKKRNPTARDVVAEQVGLSSTQLSRLLYIQKSNPEYIDRIDAGELTINKAYENLQQGGNYTSFAYGENRNLNDSYNTPYSMTEHLLRVEKFDKRLSVCEPATGNGGITKVLQKHWNATRITSYDRERDFFKDHDDYDYIITNPPFSQAIEFIHQARQRAKKKFCLLLPLNYLHGKQRHEEVYKDNQYGLSKVHVFTRSILMSDDPLRRDGKTKAGMLVFAWYVFENGYSDAPALSWIDNGADLYSNPVSHSIFDIP
jgi:hypothetical protein